VLPETKLITEIQNINKVSLIGLQGSLTADADDQLFQLVDSVMTSGIKIFIFDLANIVYINSAGFGIIIALIDEIRRLDGKVSFAALSPHLNKTAKLIGLHRFADFYRSMDEALAAL